MSFVGYAWRMHPKVVRMAVSAETKVILDRHYRLLDACFEVQGDDPPRGLWCYQYSTEFDGVWQQPSTVATVSEEGLQRVLARLAELAPTLGPARWRPKLSGQRKPNPRKNP